MHPDVNAPEDDFQVDAIHWSKAVITHGENNSFLLSLKNNPGLRF